MTKATTTGAGAKNSGAGAASAQGNTQGAGNLNIPTLTGAAAPAALSGAAGAPAPVLQDGEDARAVGLSQGAGANAGANLGDGGPADQVMASATAAPGRSLADLQAEMDAAGSSRAAMHRPVHRPIGREQHAQVDAVTMEMPTTGSVDNMRRPDQFIDYEPIADMGRFKEKAEELAFLEELVEIRIHESNNPNDEQIISLGVNGRMVYIPRGRNVIVRRKYVEQLLRAKPEGVKTRQKRDDDGNIRNFIDKTRALKYPFTILRDENPRGRVWEARIRMEA